MATLLAFGLVVADTDGRRPDVRADDPADVPDENPVAASAARRTEVVDKFVDVWRVAVHHRERFRRSRTVLFGQFN